MKPSPIIYPRYFNSEKFKLSYLEMPKSACTSIKAYLECPNDHEPCYADYPIFTVIRDPIKRFASGFIQLQRQGRSKQSSTVNEFLKVIEKYGFYERHIVPQSWFLEQHAQVYKDITLYSLDEYLKEHDLPVLNTSSFSIEMSDAQIEQIQELYKEDYLLEVDV